ncbi:unnamed protein product [Adineta steineri]|uniref:Uncharacterized protein n=1 Tax=Adineta steineri TaxID=433720 RepID=A0A819QBF3_9BILA|nr:unnamed protein product [Adineta steineri]
MVSYCSPSNDRLLTKSLIESSKCPFKSHHDFVNTSDWINGLDIWSSSSVNKKLVFPRNNIDFNSNIGLYLPRQDKLKANPISIKNDFISSTSFTNNLFPKRLRRLFKNEKNLLNGSENNSILSDDCLSIEEDNNNQSSNNNQQSHLNRIKSTRTRFPLRHVESSHYSKENQIKQTDHSSNQDKFKILLKKQLNRMFNKETTNLNCKGTLIKTISTDIKPQNNKPTRSISIEDSSSSSIVERYTKLRRVLITPSIDETPSDDKLLYNQRSPVFFRDLSTLGLSVKPLGFSPQRTLPNNSSEIISQQDNNSLLNRSLNQSVVSRCSSVHPNDEQRNLLKRHSDKGFISSTETFSNRNSFEDQTQSVRNFHRNHRSASKSAYRRSKITQLLPTVTTEKCFLIPISNHRYL